MECANCELRQRQLYCENCINSHIRDVRLQITRVASDRDDHVHKASSSSESIAPSRIRRADLATGSERLEDVKEALARLRRENDKSRARLRSLRESLATRRRTLSQARLLSLTSPPSATHQSNPTSPSSTPVPSNSVLDAQISRELQQLSLLSDTLARARSGLVSELVEVFNIVEVGGRPPIGRKAGIKGEWTIEGLVLPVPGDIRRYPPDHVNAVITHTIHFLGLLTFYLGIKLPFETSWSGKKLGVGQPWIRSIKGTENGSWAKWTSKHCLHVSTTSPANPRPSTPPPTTPPPSTSTSTSSPSPTRPSPSHRSRTTSTTTTATTSPPPKLSSSRRQPSLNVDKDMTESLSASYIEASLPSLYSPITSPPRNRSRTGSTADPPRSNASGANSHKDAFNTTTAVAAQSSSTSAHGSFTTAYTMLLYDVAYLAWTQGVDVGLSQAGEVLANLVRVCGAGDVGRRSHATFSKPPLSQPTPPSFPLDFAQLLQVQAQASAFRDHGRGAHRNRATTVTVQTSSSQHMPPISGQMQGEDAKGADGGGAGAGVVMRKESMDDLEEVEDEWDLVDERDGEEGEGEGEGVGRRKREGSGWG